MPPATTVDKPKTGSFAYVRDPILGLVYVINTVTDEVSTVRLMDVGNDSPRIFPSLTSGLAARPDGKRIYVAMGDLFVLDSASNTVVARVPMDDCMNVAVAPDGRQIYVLRPGGIFVLDTDTEEIVASIPAGVRRGSLADVVVTPDGKRAFLTGASGFVSVVDLVSKDLMSAIELTTGRLLNSTGIAVTPDGQHLYVASEEGIVTVLDANTGSMESTIAVGNESDKQRGIAITPDGARAYVARFGANAVSVLDTMTHKVVATISVNSQGGPGDRPWGIAVSPDGTHAYATSLRGHVCVLETAAVAQVGVIGRTFGDGIAIAQIAP